jgi:hypothetical protein
LLLPTEMVSYDFIVLEISSMRWLLWSESSLRLVQDANLFLLYQTSIWRRNSPVEASLRSIWTTIERKSQPTMSSENFPLFFVRHRFSPDFDLLLHDKSRRKWRHFGDLLSMLGMVQLKFLFVQRPKSSLW